MAYKIKTVDVWACDLPNRPGTLAKNLKALADAKASLEFVIARRVTDDSSRAFFAPIKGKKQQSAAALSGLKKAEGMNTLRIEGPDKPGLGALLTHAIGEAGINLRGLSAAALGKRSVCYAAFATPEDAQHAAKIAKKVLGKR